MDVMHDSAWVRRARAGIEGRQMARTGRPVGPNAPTARSRVLHILAREAGVMPGQPRTARFDPSRRVSCLPKAAPGDHLQSTEDRFRSL